MGTACACTTPTGSKGETLTFTRASTAYCTKGNVSALIENGDLVLCAADQPRVMPGGDGGSVLGLDRWQAQTNDLLRSQEFDNAAWVKFASGGSSPPSVVADQAIAPDGTMTADEVIFRATAAGSDRSALYEIPGVTQTSASLCVYVKSKTTGGTFDLSMAGAVVSAGTCTHNPTTWTRCRLENKSITAGANSPFIGNNTADNGGVARGQQTVYLWQADETAGAACGPPILTTGTAATRATETATFAAVAGIESAGSAAATIVAGFSADAGDSHGFLYGGTAGRYLYQSAQSVRVFDGTNEVVAAPSPFAPGEIRRFWSSWTGSTLTVTNATDSVTASGTFDGTMETSTLVLGSIGASNTLNGTIKQVCVDPSPTVCR